MKEAFICEGIRTPIGKFGGVLSSIRTDDLAALPLKKLKEYKNVWGISARNKEQSFAMDLLLDPDVSLVSLIGKAGSGKTLCAIAAGLQPVSYTHLTLPTICSV